MSGAAGTRETMIPDIRGSIIGLLNSGGTLAKSAIAYRQSLVVALEQDIGIAAAQAEKAGGGGAGQQSRPRRRPGMARIVWARIVSAMMVSGEIYRQPQQA